MRKLLISIAAIVAIATVIAVGGILRVRHIKPNYDETVKTNAVRNGVEIWHDSAGVPHLWAKSDADLYFAQGYVHAQERLWQMELFRRVGEGRLAEVLGESMVDTDKFLRTIGIWRAAGANEERLDSESKRLLDAYVAGVNYWIEHHSGPLPPEFTVLRIKPERWTVRNTLAIEKIMAWDLSLYDGAASLSQAVRVLGADKAKWLEPNDPAWGPTIVANNAVSADKAKGAVPKIPFAAAYLLDALSITRASNGWVIGGQHTKSAKPILANDMHLALRQPGVWYLMALHAPDLDVVGMTLPGVPNVVAGHNKAIAWGFTNVMLDDVDFFEERLDPADSSRYQTPSGSEPFTTFTETMKVKGREQPITFTVRVTRHGPIVSDVERRFRGGPLVAMQWVANDTSHTLMAIPRFNRAHSAAELLAAIPLFDDPHQNIVYADTAGHFGYQMSGRIPLRGARKRPPILPVPGWTGEWDWNGYIPFAEQPNAHDPVDGFAVTANNRQARTPVGDLISNDWELPYRALRIREMVLEKPKHDAASVHAMQLDVKDLLAVRYQKNAIAAATAAGDAEAQRALSAWDGTATRDSRAAPYFYVWYETLRRDVANTLYTGRRGANIPRDAMNAALDSGRILWLGPQGKGTLDSLSRVAMQKAVATARGKSWGDLHKVLIVHAMGEVAAVEKLLSLNVGPAPHQGSPTTVNVAQYSANGFPLTTSYGPSERHVVDMADIDGVGGFILPAGQSGLPGSEHYADMFERWRNGGLWRIPLDRKLAEQRVVHRMIIRPE